MEMEKETIEVYINKLKKGIKNLNNLLSLSKMPFQIATETGHIAIEINPSPDFCKFSVKKSRQLFVLVIRIT